MSEPFVMPKPIVGEIVWCWRNDIRVGGMEPGVVLVVNPNSIAVRRLRTQGPGDGLRHADDPNLLTGEQRKNGCWEFTPLGRVLRELEAQLCPGALEGSVSLSDTPQQRRNEPKAPPKGTKTAKKDEPTEADKKAAVTA